MPTTLPLRAIAAAPARRREVSDATIAVSFAAVPLLMLIVAVALRGPYVLNEISQLLALCGG